jgi:hypothetical protein
MGRAAEHIEDGRQREGLGTADPRFFCVRNMKGRDEVNPLDVGRHFWRLCATLPGKERRRAPIGYEKVEGVERRGLRAHYDIGAARHHSNTWQRI